MTPRSLTIWDGFRDWFAGRGLDFDYVLYSTYERQVEALLAGHVSGVEVFTRRAELKRGGGPLGLSTAGGQASLLTRNFT